MKEHDITIVGEKPEDYEEKQRLALRKHFKIALKDFAFRATFYVLVCISCIASYLLQAPIWAWIVWILLAIILAYIHRVDTLHKADFSDVENQYEE